MSKCYQITSCDASVQSRTKDRKIYASQIHVRVAYAIAMDKNNSITTSLAYLKNWATPVTEISRNIIFSLMHCRLFFASNIYPKVWKSSENEWSKNLSLFHVNSNFCRISYSSWTVSLFPFSLYSRCLCVLLLPHNKHIRTWTQAHSSINKLLLLFCV